jgi:DNA recombination protein RmuC
MFIPAEILYLVAASIAGLLAGGFIMWFSGRRRQALSSREYKALEAENDALNEQYTDLSTRYAVINAELAHMEKICDNLAAKEGEIRELNMMLSDAASREAHLEARIGFQKDLMASRAEIFEQLRTHAEQTFSSLSSKALQDNNRYFLEAAKNTFARYFDAIKVEIDHKSQSMDQLVAPITDSLKQYDRQVQAMELARQEAYGGLTQQVISLAQTQQELQKETGKLVSALRLPHVRGRWGEMTLKRVVEIAGMQNQCDFFEQPASETSSGGIRPDMIVRLPGNRSIVIDAKVPITAFLDSIEAESVEKAEEHLNRHAIHVQRHMGKLAQKAYFTGFSPTPEFVVMFMPGENFFSAALSQIPALIEEGSGKGVILATPTTLITLLKTVAYGWRQDAAVENAREVSDLASALYSRIYSLVDHFNRLGRDLDKCVGTYNKTVGSLERRVLVSARRFQEMGAAGSNEKNLDQPEMVDCRSRQVELEPEEIGAGAETLETNGMGQNL